MDLDPHIMAFIRTTAREMAAAIQGEIHCQKEGIIASLQMQGQAVALTLERVEPYLKEVSEAMARLTAGDERFRGMERRIDTLENDLRGDAGIGARLRECEKITSPADQALKDKTYYTRIVVGAALVAILLLLIKLVDLHNLSGAIKP
jgi:hypothetical protein